MILAYIGPDSVAILVLFYLVSLKGSPPGGGGASLALGWLEKASLIDNNWNIGVAELGNIVREAGMSVSIRALNGC
jgi:hypothetical protein